MKRWLAMILLLPACASTNFGKAHRVAVDEPVSVTEFRASETKTMEDSVVRVTEHPILLEKPGKVSVLVLPPRSQNTSYSIRMKSLDPFQNAWFGDRLQDYMHEVLIRVREVQRSIASGRTNDALGSLQKLKETYRGLAVWSFLEASCYVVKNDSVSAQRALSEGLKLYPKDEEALALYRRLTGKAWIAPVVDSSPEGVQQP